ncbi:MAG: GNAT family N-acetyltransferase, partial [Candidatus Ratteibacteria bacterium]|nr:GNAT family N-acetyltransferase [Candidatus Ratteibacteria bacterium]
ILGKQTETFRTAFSPYKKVLEFIEDEVQRSIEHGYPGFIVDLGEAKVKKTQSFNRLSHLPMLLIFLLTGIIFPPSNKKAKRKGIEPAPLLIKDFDFGRFTPRFDKEGDKRFLRLFLPDNEKAAFCKWNPQKKQITGIIVRDHYERQGIGRLLVNYMIEEMGGASGEISLNRIVREWGSEGFWMKMGFRFEDGIWRLRSEEKPAWRHRFESLIAEKAKEGRKEVEAGKYINSNI